jgi:CBS domain-containing protein
MRDRLGYQGVMTEEREPALRVQDLMTSAVKTLGRNAQRKLLATLVVKEVMTTAVVTATPEMPIGDAARVMLDRKVGCLPVVDGRRLVGIITESDFVRLAAGR